MSIERDLLRTAIKIIEDNVSTISLSTSLSNFIYEVDEILARPELRQDSHCYWCDGEYDAGARLAQLENIEDKLVMVEPVAWMYEWDSPTTGQPTCRYVNMGKDRPIVESNFLARNFFPLYTSPPLIRKPLSGKEISHGFRSDQDATNAESYWAGVEYAEKCHGIGEQK